MMETFRSDHFTFQTRLPQELLKHSTDSEGTAELQGALTAMLDLLKSVNDSMHQIAITGYEVLQPLSRSWVRLVKPLRRSSLNAPLPLSGRATFASWAAC